MITILILTEKLTMNDKVASSIIGGFSGGITVISVTEFEEAEAVFRSEKSHIDLFILQINMKRKSGFKIAEQIRQMKKYKNTPILFITPLSYDMVGFHPLATFKSYEKHNYISAPVERLDVQGKLGLYLDKILAAQCDGQDDKMIFLEHDLGQTFVPMKEILYGEVRHKMVTLYCRENVYTMKRMTLSGLCEMVGEEDFVQCHKSFAVNAQAVTELLIDGRRNWKAVFTSKESCPVSQTYYEDIWRRFIARRRNEE